MIRMTARALAALPKDELWKLSDGPMEVEFDPLDGKAQILVTDSRLTIFSAYFWHLYVEYPRTPALMSHHIGKERLTATMHLKLMNKVQWACYDAYKGEVDMEEISRLNYVATNLWFNAVSSRPELEEEVSTISIEDLIDVTEEPRIAAALEAITGSPGSINHAHEVAETVLKEEKSLPGNPISASVRSKLVSMAQVKQTLIARGQVTEIDSRFFREAIPSSFLSGMNTMYESMVESRSSTKAAAYKEKPIQDSEYFNRRLQLLAATVMQIEYICNTAGDLTSTGLVAGDCGSRQYVRWLVKNELDDSGVSVDLLALEGKYYRTDEDLKGNEPLRKVALSDTHLLGKVIHFRSPLLCKHDSPQSVCETCYGDLSISIPRGTNIGHVAAVEYGERVTQRMLGIKHVDFTTGLKLIALSVYEREFLRTEQGSRGLFLQQKYDKREITISVSPADADNLTELNFVQDVTRVPVDRISEIGGFYLTMSGDGKSTETVPLNVEIGGKKANFTHAFLAHIKRHGYHLSDTGRYIISLEGFDRTLPVFEVPNRDENILDYLNSIIQFISSTDEKTTSKGIPDGPRRMLKHCRSAEEALVAFHDLTSAKMNVNMVHLEVLVLSTLIRSAKQRDYRLPHPGNQLVFGQLSRIIANRSMSAAMAFEKHSALLNEPATFINRMRTDHPLDDLLVPRNAAV